MSDRWIIVDGYSVTHAWPRLRKLAGRSLENRRAALIQLLEQYADHGSRRVTVVFDGYAARHKPEVADRPRGVEVVFSAKNKTADELIERVVGLSTNRDSILVVTSDNVERQIVEGLGAQTISAELFELEIAAALRDLERDLRQYSRPPSWLPVAEELEKKVRGRDVPVDRDSPGTGGRMLQRKGREQED